MTAAWLDDRRMRWTRLPNGLRMLILHRDVVPTVDIRLVIPTAGDEDVLRVLAGCLLDCARVADHRRPAAALIDSGAVVGVVADRPDLIVSASVLADDLDLALDALWRAVDDSGYEANGVRTAATRVAAGLVHSSGPGAGLEHRALVRRFGATHRLAARPPTPSDIVAVGADRLAAAHRADLVPSDAVLVLVGRVDTDVETQVDRTLGRWTGPVRSAGPVTATAEPVPEPDLLAVRCGDAVRSSVALVGPCVDPGHPDHAAATVASVLVAGHPSAYLTRRLRDAAGLVYTVASTPRHNRYGSWHLTEFSCEPGQVRAALEAAADALAGLARGDADDGAIATARHYASSVPRLATANQSKLASALASFAAVSLSPRILADLPASIAGVTVDDVRRVLATSHAPALLTGVVEASAADVVDLVGGTVGCWTVRSGDLPISPA